MAIRFTCQCNHDISVSEALAGQPTRCPACGRRHIVPQATPAPVMPTPQPVRQPSVELSTITCNECGTRLVKTAHFCWSCGLPTQPTAPPNQPQMGYPAPPPPLPSPRQPGQLQGGDIPPAPVPNVRYPGQCCQPQPRVVRRVVMTAPFASPDDKPTVGPFHRPTPKPASTKSKKRRSTGWGWTALFFTFLALLPALLSGIAYKGAVDMQNAMLKAGAFDPGTFHEMQAMVGISKFLGGVSVFLIGIAVLAGFFGLLHFGRRRVNAFWGFVLALVLGFAVLGLGENVDRMVYHPKAGPPSTPSVMPIPDLDAPPCLPPVTPDGQKPSDDAQDPTESF